MKESSAAAWHLSRAERDVQRIHAQQILACLTSGKAAQDDAATSLMLIELKSSANALALDYAENNERAFNDKEYDKWKKVAAFCQEQLEAREGQQSSNKQPPHRMGGATGTNLLGDMTSLAYILAMNAVNASGNIAGLIGTTAASTVATQASSASMAMASNQPYIGTALYATLLVIDSILIAKHNYEVKVGDKKKREKSYSKFLEHGRWMQLMSASAWLASGILSFTVLATLGAGPIIVTMGCTMLVTSLIRIVHQVVELNKLKKVRARYQEQLLTKPLTDDEKSMVTMLEKQISLKIKAGEAKIRETCLVTAGTLVGIGLIAAGAFAACIPLAIVGAIIVLALGLYTIISNRKAIGAAFKAIFKPTKRIKPATTAAHQAIEDRVGEDDNLEQLATKLLPPELAEANDEMQRLCEEPEPDIRYSTELPEDLRTQRSIASLAHTHRPPSGDKEKELGDFQKERAEKRQEAIDRQKQDQKNDE
jgi:hypothetical protein